MKEKIINIFYEKIVPAVCNRGILEIDHTYPIRYNVNINDQIISNDQDDYVPCLMIKDISKFNDALVTYIVTAINFFQKEEYQIWKENLYLTDIEKEIEYLLILTFANAGVSDFNDPVSYLKKRTSFFEQEELLEEYPKYTKIGRIPELGESDIEICFGYQLPTLETVHSFRSRIVKEDDTYQLPNISYGISLENGILTATIYAIQGRHKNILTQYEKKINRLLYQFNKGLEVDLENSENEKNVSASSVISLTIFLKLLLEKGITNIEAVDYLPVRYREKTDEQVAVINLFKNIYPSSILESKYQKQKEEQEMIQNNITNKFIRTFNRVNYHLENMNIIYPNEIDSYMHIKLKENEKEDDNLVNIVYNTVLEKSKRK